MINFFAEDSTFKLKNKLQYRQWIKLVVKQEGKKLGALNYIFCSDAYLLHINKTYLQHNTYTDIITFDQAEKPHTVQGDIYISVERVSENAQTFQTDFSVELARVMIHGVLHLMGYDDHKEADKLLMRQKENDALRLLTHFIPAMLSLGLNTFQNDSPTSKV
ncbi:MAG TPA: rRNA maturation RNase YbeY [Microscillaceae bacterium]|nr:rRNA maturation RNase YbeY [Microscillaceae bacterium]